MGWQKSEATTGSLQPLVKLDGQITCSTAEVQAQPRLDSANEFFDFACGESSPLPIDRNGEKMIQKIVTVGDLSKHLPNNAAIRTGKALRKFFTAGLCFHRSRAFTVSRTSCTGTSRVISTRPISRGRMK